MALDKGWIDALGLDEFAHHLVNHACGRQWRRARNVELLQQRLEELETLVRVELVSGRKLGARGLFQLGNHLDACPRSLPVDRVLGAVLGVVLGLVRARHRLDQTADHLLGKVHQIVNIPKGAIKLERREFGVVRQVNVLIAELPSNFIYTLEPTDDELLQVQFWCHTHVQLHVEIIMIRLERSSRGTSGNLVHHRCLYLEKGIVVEKLAKIADNLRSLDKRVASIVIENEIEIALSEPLFLVPETEMARGQLVHAGREQSHFASKDAQFAHITRLWLGATRGAHNTDPVATTQMMMLFGKGHARRTLAVAHDLDGDALGLAIVEAQVIAVRALRHDAHANAHFDILQRVSRLNALVLLDEIGELGIDVELVRIWVDVVGAQSFNLLAAQFKILLSPPASVDPMILEKGSQLHSDSVPPRYSWTR